MLAAVCLFAIAALVLLFGLVLGQRLIDSARSEIAEAAAILGTLLIPSCIVTALVMAALYSMGAL